MSDVDDLVTWLPAQVDEDEATTRELLYWAQQTILTLQDPKLLGKHIPGWHDWPKVERMCRVRLAELDAKRRIVDRHRPIELFSSMYCTYCGVLGGQRARDVNWPCPEILDAAAPYADRPGYRQEWAPSAPA